MKIPAPRKTAPRSDIRLLPAVAGVAAILLCLKAGGLAFEASAATAPTTPPAAAQKSATPPAAAPAPAPATPAAAGAPTDPLAAINSN